MAQHERPRSDETAETAAVGGIVVIVVAVVLSILLTAALSYGVLSRGEEDRPVTTESTVLAGDVTMVAPPPTFPSPETVDVEVVAWNEQNAADIGRILVHLGAPPVRDITLLRTRCRQMVVPLLRLEQAAAAPNPAVAEAFSLWLRSVRDAVDYCLEGSKLVTGGDEAAAAGAGLGSTGLFWGLFMEELARHVDLNNLGVGPETVTPPTLP